jgi:hypothetical protein
MRGAALGYQCSSGYRDPCDGRTLRAEVRNSEGVRRGAVFRPRTLIQARNSGNGSLQHAKNRDESSIRPGIQNISDDEEMQAAEPDRLSRETATSSRCCIAKPKLDPTKQLDLTSEIYCVHEYRNAVAGIAQKLTSHLTSAQGRLHFLTFT